GWCPLSPAGTPITQLLVEPLWMPVVLWDRVTLTCQGSVTSGAATWYKDGWCWWQKGPDHLIVTKSGTCHRPQVQPPPERPCCPTDWLMLQVPARALLEGDVVTLWCRS
ncbi:FCGR2 protein, partial [Ptilorrhoa leucosticta]|nr:FCGR2 protein [Ptilorrhoa leucosticta]